MKVIDLLNKIANGEEKPEKIKHNAIIYEMENSSAGNGYVFRGSRGNKWFVNSNDFEDADFLNSEVEIIEDNNKIGKIEIDNMDRIKAPSTGNFVYNVSQPMKIMIKKNKRNNR